jgi:hypothetical protein
MATSIIASSLALATSADLKRAQLYHGPRAWVTRHGEGGERWIFERVDGGHDSFTRTDLQQSPWWRFCDADEVLSIEYQLRPAGNCSDLILERPISYIARSARGGSLIPGSRLSAFFEGVVGYEAAQATCDELRVGCADARVFQAESVVEAERYLQGVNVHAEKLERRTQEIRAEQATALARLGFAPSPVHSGHPARLQGA